MDKCKDFNTPNLSGWGCCQCKTFNGNQRKQCKYCDHERCDNPVAVLVPVIVEPGTPNSINSKKKLN